MKQHLQKHSSPLRRAFLLASLLALVAPLASFSQGDNIPRRHDGKPDLTGTYDTATLTPMTRPSRYGDKLTLTEDEAAKLADYWKTNLGKDFEQSDPDREAPPAGGIEPVAREFSGAAGGVGGYNAGFVDLGESAFKIDGEYRTSILIDPPTGQFPPLTAEAKKKRAAMAKFFHANTGEAWWIDMEVGPYDDPELRPTGERCLLGFGSVAGPPALPVMYNNLKSIVQTDTHLVVLAEMNHDARIIRIDADHDPSDVKEWLGDSVGHWEGETLVVVTKNFNNDPAFSQGSPNMTVTERFSRMDKDTLLYNFTVEDPTVWEQPFSGEYPWPASSERVYEYACHEGNYALGGILRGARLLEKEALAKKAGESGSTGGR